jgi:TetR/AcrR family transcriptional regulator, transcriptional repressor for nem operon
MGRRKEFDDETVVRAARAVFWERGYASTSLADLQTATGLSRSSLYETYGSKRGLFDRVARSYLDEIIGPLLEPMESDGAGRTEIVAYFHALSHFLRDSPRSVATRGCLMLNTAMELNILDRDAARVVRGYRARVRAAIHHALGGMADAVVDRDAKADILTAGQMGLMTTSRIDPIQAAELAETIAADIDTW